MSRTQRPAPAADATALHIHGMTRGSADLPQLWDMGPAVDWADLGDEAHEVALAENAGIGLTDRIRGWRDSQVRVTLPTTTLDGTMRLVFRDAVVVADSRAEWLIAVAAIRSIDGPQSPAQGPAGRERGGGLSVARGWVGDPVGAAMLDGSTSNGILGSVGADHIVIDVPAGIRIIPWSAIAWIRCLG